jgi:four helix bundle protein
MMSLKQDNLIQIANKEVRETKYWLRLYESSNLVTIEVDSYLAEIESIINILTKIIKTSSEN